MTSQWAKHRYEIARAIRTLSRHSDGIARLIHEYRLQVILCQ